MSHYGDVIKLPDLKYVIKMALQKFKILVAPLFATLAQTFAEALSEVYFS